MTVIRSGPETSSPQPSSPSLMRLISPVHGLSTQRSRGIDAMNGSLWSGAMTTSRIAAARELPSWSVASLPGTSVVSRLVLPLELEGRL